MGEAVVDQEGLGVLGRLAFCEVVHHAVAVPRAAGFGGAAALGGVVADGEELVGGVVAVAHLAGAHGGVAGAVEDGGERLLLEVRRAEAPLLRLRADGQMPDGAPAHDHVARWRADRAGERPHVIGAVEDHALAGEAVDVRRLQFRVGIVDLQIEGRLVVHEDEEEVRALRLGGERRAAEESEESS